MAFFQDGGIQCSSRIVKLFLVLLISLSFIGMTVSSGVISDLSVDIENSEDEGGDLGPVGSDFTFHLHQPAGFTNSSLKTIIIISGGQHDMDWDPISGEWVYEFHAVKEGIMDWTIMVSERDNESNTSVSGELAVYKRHQTEREQSQHDYHNDPMTYLVFSFVMTFGAVSIMAGLIAFRFGNKRSRMTAIPMILSGVVIWGIWILFNLVLRSDYPHDTIFGIIHWVAAPLLKPLMALLGVILGAGLSIFIFLTVIVRS
jgi:hypothetical protein